MKIEHLAYAVTTFEQGSISKAAQALYMTQPQLSNIIRDMEGELRYPIFVRQKSGVTPTPRGMQFLVHARRVLHEQQQMFELRDTSDRSRCFRISTVKTSLTLDCFLQLLRAYQDKEIHFSINEADSKTVVRDVFSQNAELGVVYLLSGERKPFLAQLDTMDILYTRICILQHHIILSCEHPLLRSGAPVSRESLYPYGMLRYTNGMLFGSETADSIWYRSFLELNRIKRYIDVHDRATMHNLLVCTDFFTLGTNAGLYQEDLHHLVSLPFQDPDVPTEAIAEMGYIYNRRTPPGEIAQQMIQLLCQAYGPA